jgi:acyl-CoA dehydrogenase
MEIDQMRSQVLHTAWMIDMLGMKAAHSEVAQCKVLAPEMALAVLDRAIQFHGGAVVAHDRPLAEMYAYQWMSRIGEGVARFEFNRQRELRGVKVAAKAGRRGAIHVPLDRSVATLSQKESAIAIFCISSVPA